MEGYLPIRDSFYGYCFDDCNNEKNIYHLNKEMAVDIWSQFIDAKRHSYFQLPDNNWLITAKQIIIGPWLEDYNNNNYYNVSVLLHKHINWKDEDTVCFCINAENMIQTCWGIFKTEWMCFLCCEDDCPILLNISQNTTKAAIQFTALGCIIKLENNDSL